MINASYQVLENFQAGKGFKPSPTQNLFEQALALWRLIVAEAEQTQQEQEQIEEIQIERERTQNAEFGHQ